MLSGCIGTSLWINLNNFSFEKKKIDYKTYRKYMGGSCLAAYYMLNEQKANVDPFSSDNLLIFSTGIVTGTPVPGAAIYSVVSKSPLTGRINESPTPGYLGGKIKKAGYDAVIIIGKANKPSVIFIDNNKVDFIDASSLWGLDTLEATDKIKDKLGKDVSVGVIGIAGENLVRYASIVNDYIFNTVRGGVGAVMGSKKLKGIAVSGTKEIPVYDRNKLKEYSDRYKEHFLENPVSRSHYEDGGAASSVDLLSKNGQLLTKNGQYTYFEESKKISGETIVKKYGYKNVSCENCFGGCKRILKKDIDSIEKRYGAPELETLGAIGAGSMIADLDYVLKACDLTSRYGLDGTSTGVVLGFANECYEKELINKNDTNGTELGFGNGKGVISLIEMIAKREGIGNILAEGVKIASEKIGAKAKDFALHVKGMETPVHDIRSKAMLGLGYAVNPNGPLYTSVEWDTDFDFNAPELFMKKASPLTIYDRLKSTNLGPEKVRMFYLTQSAGFSMLNATGACIFAFSPVRYFDYRDLVEIIDNITGWETSLFELFKLGERRINMFRAFNMREGFSPSDDTLPDRLFQMVKEGPGKGLKLDKNEFERAKLLYYKIAGWDEKTGWPNYEKLLELGIEWIENFKKEK